MTIQDQADAIARAAWDRQDRIAAEVDSTAVAGVTLDDIAATFATLIADCLRRFVSRVIVLMYRALVPNERPQRIRARQLAAWQRRRILE